MKNKILLLGLLYSSLQVNIFYAGICFSKATVKPAPEPKYIDISGIDKARLLMKIFNKTGLRTGVIFYPEARQAMLETGGVIGKLGSKDLNIDISGDLLNVTPYYNTYMGPFTFKNRANIEEIVTRLKTRRSR